ncbi:MAG: hypothetical protein V3U72_04740 [Candidatus Aenigmarchaeota archaeon]
MSFEMNNVSDRAEDYIKWVLSKYEEYLGEIYTNLSKNSWFFIGGLPSGAVIYEETGKVREPTDIDIMIEGKFDFDAFPLGGNKISENRAGGIKWEPEYGIIIDLSDCSFIDNKYGTDDDCLKPTIEEYFRYADFDTNLIALTSSRENFFEDGIARNAIKSGVIDIFYEENNPEKGITMARGIHISEKLDFKPGDGFIKFVKDNFSEKSESEIKEFLKDYKKFTGQYCEHILRRLRQMKN